MKKNKVFIIGAIVVIIILGVVYGINIMRVKLGDYLFNKDGTVVDGHADLIEHLKGIEDATERRKQIDFAVEKNIITEEEAETLY